jgi:hypothetical protein
MEFAAALMTMEANKSASHLEHLKKAIAGASKDSLLARNINARFGGVANRLTIQKANPLPPASSLGFAVIPVISGAALIGVWKMR